jgi:hypothetical protein
LPPPPRAWAKLKVTYQAGQKRAESIFAQLAEVLAVCDDEDLHPIALKGVHLAACFYAEPALRPMNDIDLLFPAEELLAAEQLLASLGYGGKHSTPEFGPGVTKHTSTFRRTDDPGNTPNPYLSAGADRMVEPHTSLEESWFGLKVDVTPGVRGRAIPVELAGRPCHVLAEEDLLLHLAVHFCFHLIMGRPSMVQLADLLVVTRQAGMNWPGFVDRAKRQKAAPYALGALSLARRLLHAPVPEPVLADLARATPARLRKFVLGLELSDILHRTQQKPLTSLGQRLRRGLRDRVETARWAPDWRTRWQVWNTAFKIGRTDTGRLLAGRLSPRQVLR